MLDFKSWWATKKQKKWHRFRFYCLLDFLWIRSWSSVCCFVFLIHVFLFKFATTTRFPYHLSISSKQTSKIWQTFAGLTPGSSRVNKYAASPPAVWKRIKVFDFLFFFFSFSSQNPAASLLNGSKTVHKKRLPAKAKVQLGFGQISNKCVVVAVLNINCLVCVVV